MYYENFEKLCNDNKTNPSRVSKAKGISTATLTSWKKGAYTPKQDKLQLIAHHFKVSVDYIITGKESEFAIEMAQTDVALSNMNERLKAYALKLSELSKSDQETIMNMIDRLGK